MNKIKSYKDLLVWQKGLNLVSEIYVLTKSFPSEEKFGLTSQMRRSAVSVPSNIAEGWGRGTSAQYSNFLKIARGSLLELETQLLISEKLNYTKIKENIFTMIDEESKMLNSLIRKVETSA
ncbi:MAG: four helix bundle protein [Flavobacteriales bacterium]|nr:four helix bundle protein [Flavobacteriales bacterium]